MDIAFEIFLPVESTITAIPFETPVFEWQGVKYPQGPEEAHFGYFKLVKSAYPVNVLSRFPNKLRGINWQCIAVREGLRELSNELFFAGNERDELKEVGKKLYEMLNYLLGHEPIWVVNFEPGYDYLCEVLPGDIDLVFEKIVSALKEGLDGYLIWRISNLE